MQFKNQKAQLRQNRFPQGSQPRFPTRNKYQRQSRKGDKKTRLLSYKGAELSVGMLKVVLDFQTGEEMRHSVMWVKLSQWRYLILKLFYFGPQRLVLVPQLLVFRVELFDLGLQGCQILQECITHVHERARTHTHTHRHVYKHVHRYTHICMQSCTNTHTHTCIQTHVHRHTRMQSHMHTHIHTHTHYLTFGEHSTHLSLRFLFQPCIYIRCFVCTMYKFIIVNVCMLALNTMPHSICIFMTHSNKGRLKINRIFTFFHKHLPPVFKVPSTTPLNFQNKCCYGNQCHSNED